jgi:hypothetical protein
VVSFTSPAGSNTIKVYASDVPDGPINMQSPKVTASYTGVAGRTAVLPSYGVVEGLIKVLVRATSNVTGVQEQNAIILDMEFGPAGTYIVRRPNTPKIKSFEITNGRSLSVVAVYDNHGSSVIATNIQLFVWPFADGKDGADYTTPDDEQVMSAPVNGVSTATLTAMLPSNGHFYIGVRATTIGGTQDENQEYQLIYASNSTTGSVKNFSARVSRA